MSHPLVKSLLVSAALGLFALPARADTTTFPTGSLIIPTSAVYQTDCGAVAVYGLVYDILRANGGSLSANKIKIYYAYNDQKTSPNRCTPTNQNKGPAYFGVASPLTTDPNYLDGCDFSVVDSNIAPVVEVDNNGGADKTLATIDTSSKTSVYPGFVSKTVAHTGAASDVNTVRYGGGPFIIHADDADRFLKLLANTTSATDSQGNPIDFSPFRSTSNYNASGSNKCSFGSTVGGYVRIHRVKATAGVTAPTPRVFSEAPPRLALLARNRNQSSGGTPGSSSKTGTISDGILENYLKRAGLDFNGAQGCVLNGHVVADSSSSCPSPNKVGQIYDLLDFEDIIDGKLDPTVYKMLWAPHWESKYYTAGSDTQPTTPESTGLQAIASYLNGQVGLMAECASIASLEGQNRASGDINQAMTDTQFFSCKGTAGVCDATTTPYGFFKSSSSTTFGGRYAASDTQYTAVSSWVAQGGGHSIWDADASKLDNCTDPVRALANPAYTGACAYYTYPGDPYSQVAEYRWDPGIGLVADFMPNTSTGSIYRSGVKPLVSGVSSMVTANLASATAARSMIKGDFVARGFKDDDSTKSPILYLAGHDLTSGVPGTKVVLQTLLQLGIPESPPVQKEVSRASPIVTNVGGAPSIVQGTYEHADPSGSAKLMTLDTDADSFEFPFVLGHMRAVPVSAFDNGPLAFEAQVEPTVATFDAAEHIPAASYGTCTAFSGGCRTVWTSTTTGFHPDSGAPVVFAPSNETVLGNLMAPDLTAASQQKLIKRVLEGYPDSSAASGYVPKLGGVDRSTVAVIPKSLVAGVDRPTMIYFGGLDGMLHAVCAEDSTGSGDPCSKGLELWAYVPRNQLSVLRNNAGRIDGSPRVLDLFGDFTGSGSRTFRTVLLFHTTSGDASSSTNPPAVYALDITDPKAPFVMWEYSTPSSRTAVELGQGLIINAGKVTINGQNRLLAFVETNNGGTGASAAVVSAIDIETGAKVWTWSQVYDSPPRAVAGEADVPSTGIPGGAVGVDKTGAGNVTDVVLGTLYGDLYDLDAATGTNRHDPNPLFHFTTNEKPFGVPPTLYASGGIDYVVAGSGGYADLTGAGLWSSADGQKVVGVSLNTPASSAPIRETTSAPSTYLPFMFDLNTGDKAFSQAVVVGGELFVTADSTDVNASGYGTSGGDTGNVYRTTIGSSTAAIVAIGGGAGSLASSSTKLYASSANTTQKLGTDALGTTGDAVNNQSATKLSRLLWLRTL